MAGADSNRETDLRDTDLRDTDPSDEGLDAERVAQLGRALLDAWESVNETHFKGALRPPVIAVVEGAAFLGQWRRDVRTIALSRALVLREPWRVVVEVVKHEMAHQYAHEVLGAVDEAAHGPAFRKVCERLGIDAAAAGTPAVDASSDDVDERVLRRVEKLLALAASDHVHEAEAAMAAAQKLMLQHNLQERVSTLGPGARRAYTFRQLGEPTARMPAHEKILANILLTHFFVRVLLVPAYRPRDGARGTVVEICGTAANVAMAVHVHAFLLRAAAAAWQEHKRARGVVGDRDRLTFFAGVMRGFDEKLQRLKVTHEEQGLVWLGDGDLDAHFERRHPRIRQARFGGNVINDAHERGREAGRQIVVHRPLGDDVAARGRMLPGRRS